VPSARPKFASRVCSVPPTDPNCNILHRNPIQPACVLLSKPIGPALGSCEAGQPFISTAAHDRALHLLLPGLISTRLSVTVCSFGGLRSTCSSSLGDIERP
jgi:hypothetical protein